MKAFTLDRVLSLMVMHLSLSLTACLNLHHLSSAKTRRNILRPDTSRRDVMNILSLVGITPFVKPLPSNAATPMTVDEAESFSAKLERKRRKPPPKLLRPQINMDFAVLMMRSSYQAMDELDCVAMDQFQKDFFFIRQAEYLPYVDSLGPGLVKQGELSDPYNFDFISFAQYATIYRDLSKDPAVVFEEQQPVIVGEDEKQQFISKVIRRDPTLLDNSLLPVRHDELVGGKILGRLNELFSGTSSAIPYIDINSDSKSIAAALQQLVNLFLVNGFAFDGNVRIKKEGLNGGLSGAQFEMVLTSPATLWSGQALALKGANPTNNFLSKTAKALFKNAGISFSSSSVKYTNTEEINTITLK